MKNNGTDLDDYPDDVFASEEAFNKRFRRVSEEEIPEPLRKRREAVRRKVKTRVTIYLDSDIVSLFKETAEKEKIGYQTLINDALRRIVDAGIEETKQLSLKKDLLTDEKFLRKLKTALTA